MKYAVLCLLFVSIAAQSEDCRREYVYCRAQAHATEGHFYKKLSACEKEYRACKKDRCCRPYEWYDSYYFLG